MLDLENKIKLTEEEREKALAALTLFQQKGKCKRGKRIDEIVPDIHNRICFDERILELKEITDDFIKETFLTPKPADIKNYMTFFELAKVPVRFENFIVTKLTFSNKIFHIKGNLDLFCIVDDSNIKGASLIKRLLSQGYTNFGEGASRVGDKNPILVKGKKIGCSFTFEYPFVIAEDLFFPFKYLLHWVEFRLWAEICDFQTKYDDTVDNAWCIRDQRLMKIFEPVVQDLYKISENGNLSQFSFKYYQYGELDAEIITKIYHKYMYARMLDIERKMALYVSSRFS